MLKPLRSGSTLIALFGVLSTLSVACSNSLLPGTNSQAKDVATSSTDAPADSTLTNVPPSGAESPSATAPTQSGQSDSYQQAVERAASAFAMSQSAQSSDDWRLVASRWQQALDLLSSVSSSSPNHSQAQSKISEYRRNLAYAQQQANRPTVSPSNGEIIVSAPARSPETQTTNSTLPRLSIAPRPASSSAARGGTGGGQVFYAPIVRRAGGTPVISVIFNGDQQFDMIVDTGASGTLITQNMASALGVVPVGRANVDTASQQGVTFPLGYVRSIEVNGVVARNVLVAVAGPGLSVGLLGHDFFGNYDVTIRQDTVEFRERG